MSFRIGKLRSAVAIAASAGLVLTGSATAAATTTTQDELLGDSIERSQLQRHLIAMQRIADAHGGNRVSGSLGHETSAEYVAQRLEAEGFEITRQEFPFDYNETLAEELSVGGQDVPITAMSFTKSTEEGGLTAPLAVVESSDAPGCDVSDYGDVTGQVALVERGECDFAQKQAAAADAGAVAALIYNNEPGPLNGTLGDADAARIPTAGVAQEDAQQLIDADGQDVTVDVRQLIEERNTYNLIAETTTGRDDNVVVAGAHIDSVADGPGINDNATGSVGLLETALQLGGSPDINNKVRFAWWGAEEFGLIGSTHYVNSLSADEQLDIAMYLNFDMIGSPNAGYFTYDGTYPDSGLPYGTQAITDTFTEAMDGRGIELETEPVSGRSDYAEFAAYGIPIGGVYTGADGVKTEEQAEKWGGEAGVTFDPCYHTPCDNLGNVDYDAFTVNGQGMADVIADYAMSTEDVNGIAPQEAKDRAAVAEQRSAQQTTLAAAGAHENTR
ncbi:amidohydrolase [Saccharomonospora sp. CUA-673]|uniref:M20/M25/M40 family metallo-hydrolase n=1 Tax=Saccharomonospora sp. CUA-673 TaxID=1904969 RepID=UPI0009644562|nr:M20/M25/M40 family metallo-hydrolase [Saccharomonospora sp. CUA-673]OLT39083.1 amidohydrolase [Saccharomonospora sp. CUA-673]